MYLYQLRKLLDQAMANMDDIVRETLLLHQFVVGLPIPISRHIRAAGNPQKLNTVVDRTRVLMTIEEQCSKTAAVCDKTVGMNELQQLQKQVEILSEQVALRNAVDRTQAKSSSVRCFNCNKIGHTTQNKCPERSLSEQRQRCHSCSQIRHYA